MSSAIQIGMNFLFTGLIVEAVIAMRWEIVGFAAFAYVLAEANYRLHHKRKTP